MFQQAQSYTIRIQGHLSPRWSDWFDGMQITHCCNGQTTLTGAVPDQSALFGLLYKIRDLGLVLLALECSNLQAAEPLPSHKAMAS